MILKLSIILLIYTIGCKNDSDKNQQQIPIDLHQNEQISFFDIFSKVELIPIETNNKLLIASVSKLIHKDKLFYILDKDQKCIFIINEKGQLVRKLDKAGKGPGEYTDISDFEINPNTNNIELLSQWGVVYTYNSQCEYISNYKLPSKIRAVHFFTNINSDLVAFYTLFEKKSLIIYSKKKSEIVNNLFEVPESVKGSPLQGLKSPFVKFDNRTLFYQGFTNTIYEFNKSKLEARYSWDFGKNNINIKKLPKNVEIPDFANYVLSNEFVNSFFYNTENPNFISTRFVCGKKRYSLFYNKIVKKPIIVSEFTEKVSPPFSAISAPDGLISLVEPLNINLLIKPFLLNKSDKAKFADIKITDNPVIIYYHYN